MRLAPTETGQFYNGNGRDVLGTPVTAEWLNAVQNEMVTLLAKAGLKPDEENVGQVLAAIQAIISERIGDKVNADDFAAALARMWIVDGYIGDKDPQFGLGLYERYDTRSPRQGIMWFSQKVKWYTHETNYAEFAWSFTGAKAQFAIRHQYDGELAPWNIITDYADANVATLQALTNHNDDANAHAALQAAINQKVTQMQTAVDAAIYNGGLYADTAAGLAATSMNGYFRVVGSGDAALQVFKNNNGVAELVTTITAKQALDNAIAQLNAQSNKESSKFNCPNLVSASEIIAGVFTKWEGIVPTVATVSGKPAIVVAAGATNRHFPAQLFKKTNLISMSCMLSGTTTASAALYVWQYAATGTQITEAAVKITLPVGVIAASRYEIPSVVLNANAAYVTVRIQSGGNASASSLSIWDLLVSEGSDASYRAPISAVNLLKNSFTDSGLKSGVMPNMRSSISTKTADATDVALTRLGINKMLRPDESKTGTTDCAVSTRIPAGYAGKYALLGCYVYSADGIFPDASNRTGGFLTTNNATFIGAPAQGSLYINKNVRFNYCIGPIPSNAVYFACGQDGLQPSGTSSRWICGFVQIVNDGAFTINDCAWEILYPITGSSNSSNNTSSNGISGSLTLTSSDRIVQIGDSYTEATYVLKDAHPVANVSALTDFRMHSFGWAGYDYLELAEVIINNTARYGTTFSELKPSHVIIVSQTNDTYVRYGAKLGFDYWMHGLRKLVQLVRSHGAIPIICSEHPDNANPLVIAQFKAVANELGCECIDVASDAHKFEYSTSNRLWEGTHPGMRTNSVLAKPIKDALINFMPRPMQQMRVFRVRNSLSAAPLSQLAYDNLHQRGQKFNELTVGHRGLKTENQNLYDSVNDGNFVASSHTMHYEDEYMKMQRGAAVSFNGKCLVETILPATGRDLSSLVVSHNAGTAVQIYALNKRAALPYTSAQRRGFFGIATGDLASVVVGDTYSDGSNVFTVMGSYQDTLIMSEVTPSTNKAGVLIRQTGGGIAQLNYTGTTNACDPAYYTNIAAPMGTWELIENGVFSNIARYVQEDKLSLLLVHSSNAAFTMSDIRVDYAANQNKRLIAKPRIHKAKGKNMLADSAVASGPWILGGNAVKTTVDVGSGSPPAGISDIVRIAGTGSIKTTITLPEFDEGTELEFEVWCRRYEPLHSPTADIATSPINENTYNFIPVDLLFGFAGLDMKYATKVTELAWLGWGALRFRVTVPSAYTKILISGANASLRDVIIQSPSGAALEIAAVKYREV